MSAYRLQKSVSEKTAAIDEAIGRFYEKEV
jgi:hypothetical protein